LARSAAAVAAAPASSAPSRIRVGIGGWSYDPWRETFYPEDLPASRELSWASRQVSMIEINSTFYGSQKPATFAKWRDDTPDGFLFSVKASRFATNRRVLADGAESVHRFLHSGIAELGPKLGPLLWQFAESKVFDRDEFAGFMDRLPADLDGLPLRHVLDVRHPSFMTPEYLALARERGVATVFADSDEYPSFADLTAPFVYARLMRTESRLKAGYAPKALDGWAAAATTWAEGDEPAELPRVSPTHGPGHGRGRDVFMLFIAGAKEKAPLAAQALLQRLGWAGPGDGA